MKTMFRNFVLAFAILFSGILFMPVEAEAAQITYRAHVAAFGWLGNVSDGGTAGTTGQSRRMEGLYIWCDGITYRAHCANVGWQPWRSSGQLAGTTGQSLQMECVEIKLNGSLASQYDVVYRAHCAGIGWTQWVSNGAPAGTTGEGRRMEAVQIKLVKKSSYDQLVNSFLADSRWKPGTKYNGSQRPKLSSYSCSGCCAYAADFVKYVFGKSSPRSGSDFYSPSEIRAGDVIRVTGSQHWFVVLYRNGNNLVTVEGNWTNGCVQQSTGAYTISGNTLKRNGKKFRTFSVGYHFM